MPGASEGLLSPQQERHEDGLGCAWLPSSKISKTSFSGGIRLSSSSFRLSADLNNPVFFFGPLVLETSHSSIISLEMTLLRGPLNIRIGKEGGIPAILDAENHF